MLSRRNFMQAVAALAAAPAGRTLAKGSAGFGELVADRKRIIDLPADFSYNIIARAGSEMSDGLRVPGAADGMAAFSRADGKIALVCNHENEVPEQHLGAFGRELERLHLVDESKLYDLGGGKTPGPGGTTTIIYDSTTRTVERQFLTLAGTEINCAGGPTPWGSWLSCEESFGEIGPAWELNRSVVREQAHGYIFEVPSSAEGLVDPVPLKDMGRFEHEAAAVDPRSGVVYLTEDRHRSLLYRFIPNVPGELLRGGQLQALAMSGKPSFDTRNWTGESQMSVGDWMAAEWIDLEDVDNSSNDLRLRGHADGAARFARGEGICHADGSAFFTCTIGGPHRLGQVFEYRISPYEGTPEEQQEPGQIRLIAQADQQSLLRNCDNITMGPWGDLVVCEDTADHCGLVGIKADGSQYPIADNAYTDSELTGICFAPDGKTMFVNIQDQGLTLAINGPW